MPNTSTSSSRLMKVFEHVSREERDKQSQTSCEENKRHLETIASQAETISNQARMIADLRNGLNGYDPMGVNRLSRVLKLREK